MESRFFGKQLALPFQIPLWLLAFYVTWYFIPQGIDLITANSFSPMFLFGVIQVVLGLLLFVPQLNCSSAIMIAILLLVQAGDQHGLGTTTALSILFCAVIGYFSRPPLFKKYRPITKISI